jgi:hypothetical protein
MMEYVLTTARQRLLAEDSNTKPKKTIDLGELRFNIVDKKGRKIKVMIKNDSDNEEVDSSDEEGTDANVESGYYHLMVEDQKVLPYKRKELKATHGQKSNVSGSKIVPDHATTAQIKVSHPSEKSANRVALSRAATSQGLTFANEQQFDSFVSFIESLPKHVNQQKAIVHYKEMVAKVMADK